MITKLASAIGVFQHIGYTRRPLLPWRPPPEAMPWRRVVSATRYFSGEYQQVKAVEEEKHSYENKNENLKLCDITMTPPPPFFFIGNRLSGPPIILYWWRLNPTLFPWEPCDPPGPQPKKIPHPLLKAINIDWSLTTYNCLFPWPPLYRKHENTSLYKTVLSYLLGSSCCQNGRQLFRRSFYKKR